MCNACGIRWKRAHQSGSKAKQNEYMKSKPRMEEASEEDDTDQRSENESFEEAAVPSDHEVQAEGSSSDTSLSKRVIKRKRVPTRKTKPYTRAQPIKIYDDNLESQIQAAMFLLQQAAEEFEDLENASNGDYDVGSPYHHGAMGSPVHSPPSADRMDVLYNEVMALRQEVEKQDAMIQMFKSRPSSSSGKSPHTQFSHGLVVAN